MEPAENRVPTVAMTGGVDRDTSADIGLRIVRACRLLLPPLRALPPTTTNIETQKASLCARTLAFRCQICVSFPSSALRQLRPPESSSHGRGGVLDCAIFFELCGGFFGGCGVARVVAVCSISGDFLLRRVTCVRGLWK